MAHTFKEIEKQIERDRGHFQASLYRESYEADGHWSQDRVFSRFDAEDGADFPRNHYANEAYRNLDTPRDQEGTENL